GNRQGNDQTATGSDGSPPAIVDAVTGDRDSDGRIDRITLTFSELVQHAPETTGASLQAAGFATTAVSGPVNGREINVDFTESAGFNSGVKPTVNINTTGVAVTDFNGNAISAVPYTTTRDGVAPVLTTVRTRDLNANGALDALAATFSETVTYTAMPGAFDTGSSSVLLGTLDSDGIGTALGSVVTLTLNEASCCNTDLPTVLNTVNLHYVTQISGGVHDVAGLQAIGTTPTTATDGAGPVINFAATEDSGTTNAAPAQPNGFLDHMYIGFTEPVVAPNGEPFRIASGERCVKTTGVDAPTLMTTGPYAGKIRVTLAERSLDDTGDRPTVAYQPQVAPLTGCEVSAGTQKAQDATGNEVVTTAAPFTGAIDKAAPVLRDASTSDSSPVDGYVDHVTTLWSEPISTTIAPTFSLNPSNGPFGYAAPTVASGSIAGLQTVSTPLTPSAKADRDVTFQTNYVGPGITDQATVPNAAVAPSSFTAPNALCSDLEEATGSQDDDAAHANATGLQTAGGRHLATLCGNDPDFYSFNVPADTVVKVLFAPASEAFGFTGRNASFDPFTITGPGSPTVTTSFTAGIGWEAQFTSDGTGGIYALKLLDGNSPAADYGYCIARTEGGATPSCEVRQGDLAITEILDKSHDGDATAAPFIELKNVSSKAILTSDISGKISLQHGSTICTLQAHNLSSIGGATVSSIGPGEFFIISGADLPTNHDFSCDGIGTLRYDEEVRVFAADGTIDAVEIGNVDIPLYTSAQLRPLAQYESSASNDDISQGWCASIDYHGSPAAANANCDQFRVEEVMFMPTTSTRDGRVFVELRGNSPINAASALLAGWQIRIKPQGSAATIYTLPATATPTTAGFYVLADTPDAGGNTYVPFYSAQDTDLAGSPPALDSVLRADVPMTVSLLAPGHTCAVNTPRDTVGFIPGMFGSMSAADTEGNCPGYVNTPYSALTGFADTDSFQRKPYASYSSNNFQDFCAITPATPLGVNTSCEVAH
ncbi:MAG: hypothetical protein JHC87_04500, partial [Thermoleophilaceae bacterium]|nr:hypothetical protein [Thermoleophilaceae bacterium]